MKLRLDLTTQTIEYLDQAPFIQGTATGQNKIELSCDLSAITAIKVAYSMADGKSTIALTNDARDTDNQVILFNLPLQVTNTPGKVGITFVVTTSSGTYKFNASNKIIPSVKSIQMDTSKVFTLKEGMVIAIEPMLTLGKRHVRVLSNDWTVVTRDGKPSAHFEHTVAIGANGPDILTTFDFIEEQK